MAYLGIAAAAALLVLWEVDALRIGRETQRLAGLGDELTRLRLPPPVCSENRECECAIPSRTFTACKVIVGHVVLWIDSNDKCFKQWVAVREAVGSGDSAMYLGRYWVSRRARPIARDWSLLAIAPCVD